MSNTAHHDWVDSVSAWAEANPQIVGRAHRALPLSADWPTRRADQRAALTLQRRFPQCNGACDAGRSACGCRPAEMAVYDPANDDKRPRMTKRDAWVTLGLYLLSCGFAGWLFYVLSAYFKGRP